MALLCFCSSPILVSFLLLFNSCGNEDKNNYVYPGSGIPHISRNVAFAELNAELSAYAGTFPSTRIQRGRLDFSEISNFHFVSRKGFGDRPFSVQVQLGIQRGCCELILGGVIVKLTSNSVLVEEHNRTVYGPVQARVEQIVFDKFSPGDKGEVILSGHGGIFKIINIHISAGQRVGLSLTEGACGFVGPWEWLRGYE